MNKKVESRRHSILDELKKNGHTTISRLACDFNVSESTIKRDLNALVMNGFIKRTHGGAFVNVDAQEIRIKIPLFSERQLLHEKEKQQIAKVAAVLIEDGDTVFLDAGSTINLMIDSITAKNVTVFTNSIAVVISALNTIHDLDIRVLCGKIDFDHLIISGIEQIEQLESLYFDKAFLSCQYISSDLGVMASDFSEKIIKNKLVKNSRGVILCADSSKIGKINNIVAIPFDQIDYFVTDSNLGVEDKEIIQKAGTIIFNE